MTYEEKARALALWLKESFNLHAWDIYIRTLPQDKMPGGADGFCDCNHRYLTAHIDVAEGLDDARLRRVVAHEVSHVLLSPIDSMWCTTIGLLDRPLRRRENEEKDHIQEQVAQMLSKFLAGLECVTALIGENNNGSGE